MTPTDQFASTSLHYGMEMQSPSFNCGYVPMADEKPPKREKRKYRCRKRSPATIERAKIIRRDKANTRERRRMNSLNDALEHLRTVLPHLPDEPKMTKIETLRKAQEYIASLSSMLSSESSTVSCTCENAICSCRSVPSSVNSSPFVSPNFPPAQHYYPYNPQYHQYQC